MGALPGLRVMAPSDPIEARACTRVAGLAAGPSYLRLGRNGEKQLHTQISLAPEAGEMLRVTGSESSDVVLIGGCGALDLALETGRALTASGIDAAVWSSPFITPFDVARMTRFAIATRLVISVEEHSEIGGLGSRCAQVIASAPSRKARLLVFGIPPVPQHQVGDQCFMRSQAGLTVPRIRAAVIHALDS